MDRYDVIIVGARVAGAATALPLARAGRRVLVLDHARRGSDTLSTHALMRPAVLQLERWGLLDDVVAAGTPGQDQVVFHYGDRRVSIDTTVTLYAPRRTVLDPIIVDAAERAGATFRFGVHVDQVLQDDRGQVVGVRIRDEHGDDEEVHSRFTVGADGRRSTVANQLRPTVTRASTATSAFAYGYWTGVHTDGYEWCYRPGSSAGLIPTGGGQTCVFVGVPPERFTVDVRRDLGASIARVLEATTPSVAERVAQGERVGPARGFAGMLGWLRRPWGPGWALVGDAGYFKDPTTAHGITDALRDAVLLASALDQVLTGAAAPAVALADYERVRDELSLPFFEMTDAIASFDWTLDEVQQFHLRMSKIMQREVEVLDSVHARPGTPLVA